MHPPMSCTSESPSQLRTVDLCHRHLHPHNQIYPVPFRKPQLLLRMLSCSCRCRHGQHRRFFGFSSIFAAAGFGSL